MAGRWQVQVWLRTGPVPQKMGLKKKFHIFFLKNGFRIRILRPKLNLGVKFHNFWTILNFQIIEAHILRDRSLSVPPAGHLSWYQGTMTADPILLIGCITIPH